MTIKTLSAFLLTLAVSPLALANGGRTHAECGQRAFKVYFSQAGDMLPGLDTFFSSDEIKRAFYSGCYLPDFGYSSGSPDQSEDAHWHDFQEAYLQFLKETCPPPWDDETKRRVAFFFGLVVHGISDIPWHFTDGEHKAVIKMAEVDGGGHNSETDMDYFTHVDCTIEPSMPRDAFWFPYDDVVAVFKKRPGPEVSREAVVKGTDLLKTAWTMGAGFGRSFYPKSAEALPWCKAHYQDYYYGGVEHGAAAAAMWLKSYYSRLNGWHYFQQMPVYACKPPSYVPYLGVEDASILQSLPDHNTGAEPVLELSPDGQRQALIRFDVSEMPADQPISKASLWLYLASRKGEQKGDMTLEAYRVQRPWKAGAGKTDDATGIEGRVATPGEITWTLSGEGSEPWAAPGCAKAPEDRDESPAATVVVQTSTPTEHWIALDVTQAVVEWAKDPGANRGVLLKVSAPQESCALQFFSSDAWKVQADGYGGGQRVAFRPTLIVME